MTDFNTGLIALGVGAFMVSTGITYMLWCRVRVIFLRQDLFTIRDGLWDRARELKCFNDAEYISVRRMLNDMIAVAPDMSLPLLNFYKEAGVQSVPSPVSLNPAVHEACEDATHRACKRVLDHMKTERASGALSAILSLLRIKTLKITEAFILAWSHSEAPGSLREMCKVAAR